MGVAQAAVTCGRMEGVAEGGKAKGVAQGLQRKDRGRRRRSEGRSTERQRGKELLVPRPVIFYAILFPLIF